MASQATVRARQQVDRRRSARLPSNVTFIVSGEVTGRQLFQEEALTLSVNAHGALIALLTEVALGQKLLLISPKTWRKREGRVVRLNAMDGERTRVAIEFARPDPDFWFTGVPPRRWFPSVR
jgi:hypothetical protein